MISRLSEKEPIFETMESDSRDIMNREDHGEMREKLLDMEPLKADDF